MLLHRKNGLSVYEFGADILQSVALLLAPFLIKKHCIKGMKGVCREEKLRLSEELKAVVGRDTRGCWMKRR